LSDFGLKVTTFQPGTLNHTENPLPKGFSYGQMQTGDIIGPWIFEDLQKALSALH